MAFQNIRQFSRWVDFEGLGLGIHLGFFGRKHHIAASGFQLFAIGIQGTGIGIKILMRGELQAVYENGRDSDIAQGFGLAHQCQMSGVQIAHRGNNGGVTVAGEMIAQFGDSMNQVHEIKYVEYVSLPSVQGVIGKTTVFDSGNVGFKSGADAGGILHKITDEFRIFT